VIGETDAEFVVDSSAVGGAEAKAASGRHLGRSLHFGYGVGLGGQATCESTGPCVGGETSQGARTSGVPEYRDRKYEQLTHSGHWTKPSTARVDLVMGKLRNKLGARVVLLGEAWGDSLTIRSYTRDLGYRTKRVP
jgi:hypothetical protein